MDTILNINGIDYDLEPIPSIIDDTKYDFFYLEEKACTWVIDGDIIRPSTNLILKKKLSPGIYIVESSRDIGIFCKKINVESDYLITFSDSVITNLLEEISTFWSKAELYKENNLLHKRGILLEGPPGDGKSSLISLLSKQIIDRGGVVFIVPNFNNLNLYVEFIKNSFRAIEPDRPIITIMEDIDKFQHSESILDFLDGKTNIEHHLVLATTNNTEDLPDSFLRPSRIDIRILMGHPSKEVRREYFMSKQIPEPVISDLVNKTEDFSIADLKELYISVFLLGHSIEESVIKIKTPSIRTNYNRATKFKNLGI